MQSFDATLKFDPHFMCLCLNHFGGLSMKMSWAYTGMLSSEIDDFKFLTTVKNIKSICSRAHGTVLPLQTSPSLTRNINVKVAIELYYIFSKISKFRYW